ncbi:MAG: nuclear transport factor 2 family protein [Proteobacteria bacterium]|nr:nuclear transport factor 2 family protein [Pseudomonadota bacterium]
MQNDATHQLRALNARFIHNFITNDVKSHAAITHERFVCMTSRGARETRRDYLARWATGFDPEVIVYWDTRDEQISLFGAVALVRSTNKHVIRKDGKETTGMTTYTDTYIHENGEWKCIQAQLTPVSPDHYPGDETIVRKYIKGQLQE